ncbi:MAG: hypothetical protein J6Q70_03915 [Clostridia bacterium]|nr:hypothetical protein [Clostridia bacterium]
MAAYRENIHLDYKEEIQQRSAQIATLVGLHTYTVDLLVYICLTRHLRELYLQKGIDVQIFQDSVRDLKWKLEECKIIKGICGSFVASWFPGFFRLERFALGRLQFEITTAQRDYEKKGIKLQKGISRVINVHIPRTGRPMDKESCDASYAAARAFFADELGENCVFACGSWLLFPENKNIVPPTSNTYRFLCEYDVVDWGYNEGQDLWRLFDTTETDPEKLPTNTSLRRAYAEHLKNGGKVGWGIGYKI